MSLISRVNILVSNVTNVSKRYLRGVLSAVTHYFRGDGVAVVRSLDSRRRITADNDYTTLSKYIRLIAKIDEDLDNLTACLVIIIVVSDELSRSFGKVRKVQELFTVVQPSNVLGSGVNAIIQSNFKLVVNVSTSSNRNRLAEDIGKLIVVYMILDSDRSLSYERISVIRSRNTPKINDRLCLGIGPSYRISSSSREGCIILTVDRSNPVAPDDFNFFNSFYAVEPIIDCVNVNVSRRSNRTFVGRATDNPAGGHLAILLELLPNRNVSINIL